MADSALVDRLVALPRLESIPRHELEWLADHGEVQVREAGEVMAPIGQRIDHLFVILDGLVAVKVDRGSGPKIVTEWQTGDVTGMLPYSRMTVSPGNNYAVTRSELLAVPVADFTEMTHVCPVFTAHTVHAMLDRARRFKTSDLQDEKLISLGRLAAGLAHELNNPAAAAVRSAKMLIPGLLESDAASRALGAAHLDDRMMDIIERVRSVCEAKSADGVLSSLERADREDEIADWLEDHDLDAALAEALATTVVSIEELDELAAATSGETLSAALKWIAAGCTTRSLAADIEEAATRISDLVAAIKRFTFMDQATGSESVDVGSGLRDTVRIVASKARSRGASIRLDVDENLPRVRAIGSELNQVWLNLIDNALDAVPDDGKVVVTAFSERDRVVVSIVDDGPGIPEDIQSRIFDPFFTTKPPGQGTGLGLDMARRLLRQYHGELTLDTRPGRTEFRASMPVAKD